MMFVIAVGKNSFEKLSTSDELVGGGASAGAVGVVLGIGNRGGSSAKGSPRLNNEPVGVVIRFWLEAASRSFPLSE